MSAVFPSPEALLDAVGTDLGVSDWITVGQERIDRFADATDDHQWIHIDPERAASGPFGKPIAHGYLSLSLLAPLMFELLHVDGTALVVNAGLGPGALPHAGHRGHARACACHDHGGRADPHRGPRAPVGDARGRGS